MRKVYKIEVDCPTCAAKLEECACKLDGVESCNVNLMTQKMTIVADEQAHPAIIKTLQTKMKKIDDDVVIYG